MHLLWSERYESDPRCGVEDGELTGMTGDEFSAALKAVSLTQKDFGEIAGVSRISVNRWATGLVSVPQYIAALVTLMSATDVWRSGPDWRAWVIDQAR